MVNIYVKRILSGIMKIEQVPQRWKEQVGKRMLELEKQNNEKNEENL